MAVRCQRCFSLQRSGTGTCGQCASELELEPVLVTTRVPCPRCATLLETSEFLAPTRHECPSCGGIFVSKEVLADILAGAEASKLVVATEARTGLADEVRYLSCPECLSSMNRTNFGKVSGVVVDVCKPHGTWFDAGELTRAVAFAGSGGFDKTRAREERDRTEERGRLRASLLDAKAGESQGVRTRTEAFRDLFEKLFGA